MQGQKKEARQYVKRLLQMGSGSGILIAAVILLGRGWLPQLFSPDPHVIAAAARALPIVAAAMVRCLCASLFPCTPQSRVCGRWRHITAKYHHRNHSNGQDILR